MVRKLLLSALLLGLALSAPRASANPIGDFFKSIGHGISKVYKSMTTPRDAKKSGREKTGNREGALNKTGSGSPPAPTSTPKPSPTPTPIDIRPAALAPPGPKRRDVPYGLAVPNKPGFVQSPYAPKQGYVDVRAFPSSTEVLDPFTGKIFLTP